MRVFQLLVIAVTFGAYEGIPVTPHPTVVHVLYHEHKTCDGSILSENIILTAAHCIIGYWHKRVQVLLPDDRDHSLYNVTSIKYHKNYNPISGTSDIALLNLKNRIDPKHGIVFIQLPTERVQLVSNDSQCLAYRWTQASGPEEDMLLSASVDPIVPLKECAKTYGKPVDSLRGFLCAKSGRLRKIRETTGGPVLMDQHQVGIVISTRPTSLKPIFFTDVTFFLSWINETRQQMTNCDHSSTSFYPLPRDLLDSYAEYRGEPVQDEGNVSTVAIVNRTSSKLMCIGTIISSDFVLTTARCVKKRWKDMRAHLISRNSTRSLEKYTFIKVHKYKDFDVTSLSHIRDVALIRVEPAFNIHHGIQRVEIASRGDSIQPLTAGSVYGMVDGSGMRRLDVFVIDHEECNWIYRKRGRVHNGTICGATYHGMCNHVSGEPLIIGNQLVGILTTAPEDLCGDFRYPAIFIDITANLDWIKSRISQGHGGGLKTI